MPLGLEFVPDAGTSLTVGSVSVPGVYNVRDSRAMQAPDHRVEEDFDFTTRVGAEPIEAEIDAWVESGSVGNLQAIAELNEPFPVSVGTAVIGECVLDAVDVNEEGQYASSFDCTIAVREVQLGSTGTANIKVVSEETGTKSEKGGKAGDGPSITQTDSQTAADGPGSAPGSSDSPFSGIVSGTRSWLGYD